ncbi:autotransporter outer membrane beta-barrel domain-containing protein, partial [Acidocella aminolytica]
IGSLIDAGLYNVADGVSITNDGTIVASKGNISITGNAAGLTTVDGIYNAGSLIAITNDSAGLISGGSNGIDNEGSIGVLANSGAISGSIGISNSGGSIGTLTNSGTISVASSSGIDNIGGSIGTLTNSGTISGASGVDNGGGSIGKLTNSGTISGRKYAGIYNGSGSIGTLVNDGTVSGMTLGDIYNEKGAIGTLVNAGSITGTGTNVISSGKTITGPALSVDNTGGTIGALIDAGLYNGADGVSITNDGTITASTSNVSITGNAAGSTNFVGIYNFGSINALTNDRAGVISGSIGISESGGSIGMLTNNGMITGMQDALYIGPGSSIGQLSNSGTVAGNIDNASSLALKISGGTGTDYGVLTGYNGTTGSITSKIAGADLTFDSGNLLLGDNIYMGGNSVIDTGATLLVDGLLSIVSSSPLDIAGGLLEVGDAAHNGAVLNSNVAIGSAGELRGHGTIRGNVTNDGVVYPGGSMGVLTIDGNYVQNSGGSLEVEVSPVTTVGTGYDQLAVTGSAKLAGALEINVDSGAYIGGDQYDIVTAAGGVSGTFSTAGYTASFSTALKQYLTPTLNYTADNVYLDLVPAAPAFSTGRFYAASAYAQNNALLSVLGAPLGMDSGDNEVDRGYWLHGIGNFGSDNGYDFNAKGFVIGKGFDVSANLVIGGAVSNVYTSTNGSGSSVNGTSFGALVYGLYNVGRLSLSASAGAGHMSDNINRYLPSLGWQAKAASNGVYEGFDAQLQYSLLPTSSPYFLAPYAQGSYLHTALGSAQETNAGILNLHYDALNTSLAQLGAGITGGYNVPVKYGMLTAWASLGGLGTLGNPHASVTEQMGTYTARETALAAPVGALNPGVGLQLIGNSPWRLAAGWSGLFGSATSAENLTFQASYKW